MTRATAVPPSVLRVPIGAASVVPAIPAIVLDPNPNQFAGPYDLMSKLGLQGKMTATDRAIFFLPRVLAAEGAKMAARLMSFYLFGDAPAPYAAPGAEPGSRGDGEGPLNSSNQSNGQSAVSYRLPFTQFKNTRSIQVKVLEYEVELKGDLERDLRNVVKNINNDKFFTGQKFAILSELYPMLREKLLKARASPGVEIAFGSFATDRLDDYSKDMQVKIKNQQIIGSGEVGVSAATTGLDDLLAGLGSCALKAYVAGVCTFTDASDGAKAYWSFEVRSAVARIVEPFTFSGEGQRFQPLGVFSSEKFYNIWEAATSAPVRELYAKQYELGQKASNPPAKEVPAASEAGEVAGLSNHSFTEFARNFKRTYNEAVTRRNHRAENRAHQLSPLLCREFETVTSLRDLRQAFTVKLTA